MIYGEKARPPHRFTKQVPPKFYFRDLSAFAPIAQAASFIFHLVPHQGQRTVHSSCSFHSSGTEYQRKNQRIPYRVSQKKKVSLNEEHACE